MDNHDTPLIATEVSETEELKMTRVRSRFENIDNNDLIDGDAFFQDLDSGQCDC